jgi:hypothetical protein
MFEFYIWLMISDGDFPHWTPDEYTGLSDEEIDKLEEKEEQLKRNEFERLSEALRQACADVPLAFDLFKIKSSDGGLIATAGHSSNHGSRAVPWIRKFMELLAAKAPATYGVAYMLDTDRGPPIGNFDVLKLAHQTITQTTDLLVPSKFGPK